MVSQLCLDSHSMVTQLSFSGNSVAKINNRITKNDSEANDNEVE